MREAGIDQNLAHNHGSKLDANSSPAIMKEKESHIIIENDGTIRFLYDYNSEKGKLFSDELVSYGTSNIERRSHINPKVTENGVKFFVDLSPSNGPELGPFETRQEAIEAEEDWINSNWLK